MDPATGLFFGVDGQTTRPVGVDWPASPEETGGFFANTVDARLTGSIVYTKPYIISSFPPNSLPALGDSDSSAISIAALAQTPTIPNSALQIRSALSLQPVQTLKYPFIEDPTQASSPPTAKSGPAAKQPIIPPHTLRLLTTSPGTGPGAPTFVLSTPTDRAALASEGSTLWALILKPWREQVDELVRAGKYADALALLGVVSVQPDDPTRHIQGLRAVQLFQEGQFEKAIEMFLELDMNPAKVIALYPESISGRLAAPRDKWIELFGGEKKEAEQKEEVEGIEEEKSVAVVEGAEEEEVQKAVAAAGVTTSSTPAPEVAQSPPSTSGLTGGLSSRLKAGLGAMKLGDDSDSVKDVPVPKAKKGAGMHTISLVMLA
jgi:hypothetical protein